MAFMNAGFGVRFAPDFFAAFRADFFGAAFLAVDFFAALFFAVDFFAVDFFAVDFFAADFLAGDFRAELFFAGDRFAADFFAPDFLAPPFFAADFLAAGFRTAAFLPVFFLSAIHGLRQGSFTGSGNAATSPVRTKMNWCPCICNKKICIDESENLTVIASGVRPGIRTASQEASRRMATGSSKQMIGRPDGGEAHVWVVPLELPAESVALISACLSPDERERHARLPDDAARRRFAVSRGALRHILGLCSGRSSGALSLLRGTLGKPHLEHPDGVEFSVSHSGEIALVAVAATAVGVDIEHLRQRKHATRTAERVLHPDTARLLQRLPEPERTDAFLAAWTLREAHVKAVGGGLFRTPDTLPFDPGLPCDGTFTRLAARGDGEQWSAARFVPAPLSMAALVARGPLHLLHIHHATETRALLEGNE
jgi:4'-phosphopantetheinyl transferase